MFAQKLSVTVVETAVATETCPWHPFPGPLHLEPPLQAQEAAAAAYTSPVVVTVLKSPKMGGSVRMYRENKPMAAWQKSPFGG